MLDKIKILLGMAENDSKDELLLMLISLAKEEATVYCNLAEYTSKLDSAIIGMVIERYNRIGAEGLTSASTSGVSENYIDGYSSHVVRLLNRNRRIKTV